MLSLCFLFFCVSSGSYSSQNNKNKTKNSDTLPCCRWVHSKPIENATTIKKQEQQEQEHDVIYDNSTSSKD